MNQAKSKQSENLWIHKKMHDLVLFTTSEVPMHLRSDERGGGGHGAGDGEGMTEETGE